MTTRLRADWPYWAGGVALAAANTALLLLVGRPWSITSTLTHIGVRSLQLLGLEAETWLYFQGSRAEALAGFDWLNSMLWLNLGLVAGVLLAGIYFGEWRSRPTRNGLAALTGLGGGLLMGYGARLALGCNAGALLGGIPSFSIHGWLFALFTFLGVLAGIKLFQRVLLR